MDLILAVLAWCAIACLAIAAIAIAAWLVGAIRREIDIRRHGPATQPQDPPDDDVPVTVVHVSRSPLARVSHRSDEHATTPTSYVPRHAVVGPRPWRVANLTTTQLHFDVVLAAAGEDPPRQHGPREAELSCTRMVGLPPALTAAGAVR